MVYEDDIALVNELLTEFGETATVVRKSPGLPDDPSKPWEPGAPVEDPNAASAVFLDSATARRLGTIVPEGSHVAYVDPSEMGSFVPNVSTDVVRRADGSEWAITSVDTLSPNGELVLHILTVRR